MSQNLSSAAVLNGALRVKTPIRTAIEEKIVIYFILMANMFDISYKSSTERIHKIYQAIHCIFLLLKSPCMIGASCINPFCTGNRHMRSLANSDVAFMAFHEGLHCLL